MTLNILEPDREINDIENSDIVAPRRFDTEEKRIEFLRDMLHTMKNNTGVFDGPPGFLDILSQSLCDKLPASRCLALDILCGIIPGYTGNQIDMLFPQLLQNLLHNHTSVKKATLQVLHLYFKYSQDKSVILDFLIKYGIKSEKKALQNEVLLAMPALIRSGFTQKQLENIFISILSTAFSIDNGESSLPIVLCLEHVKDEMGDARFPLYFNSLDKNLRNLYRRVVKLCLSLHHEPSKSKSSNSTEGSQSNVSVKDERDNVRNKNVTDDVNPNDTLVFGFVPNWIISKLDTGASWQERSDVINEFLAVVSTRVNDEAMKGNCGELLTYLCALIEDLNFNVALTSLTILHKVIVKVGPAIKYHLDMILKALVKKLHDPKLVVKKINLRIALSLMHSVTPKIYIQNILPLLKHKSARVREEIINMITAALLSFPSSYFDLSGMASQFSFTLLDPKRRVRHASLECLAILAQKLGSGKLSPLVSAIDKIENEEGGKGVLAAVQARLARRILPRINDEGYIQYALNIPVGALQIETISLDMAWVIAGTTSDSAKQLPEKRYFSAGKKKLPWQADERVPESPTRKDIGSAPIRKGLNVEETPNNVTVPVVRDTWVTDSLLANKQSKSFHKNKFVVKSPQPVENNKDPDPPQLQKDVSYFEVYKNKMKKLKAAGLQADAQMINSINPNMAFRNSLNSDIDQKYLKDMKVMAQPKNERSNSNDVLLPLSTEQFISTSPTIDESGSPTTTTTEQEHSQYTPIPLKPTLARSASKKRLKIRMDEKKQESTNQTNHSEQSTQGHSNLKIKQEKQRAARGGGHSPFPLKPTIHRTPSGKMNIKPILGNHDGILDESSNLKNMAEYSFSSPNLSGLSNGTEDASSILRNDSCSPTIRTSSPRIKDALLGNIMNNSGTHYKDNNTESSNDDLIDDNDNENPKLAKSAQEKLRKLKEERLRHSVDIGYIKNKKENRLSRSLDFKSVGLIDIQTNDTDENIYTERSTYSDLPKKYLRKNKHNRTIKGKQSKTKPEKHKDTAIDDLYNSIQLSNACTTKPKDYKHSESPDGIAHDEKSFHKAKELKDYNERLQLDLSFVKSYDTSEASSLSPNNTTFQTNSSFGNSTHGSNTPGSISPRNITPGNGTPGTPGNTSPGNTTHVGTEEILEVKGASVFDANSESRTDPQENNNIKYSRKIEKKKKSKKVKQNDVNNDVIEIKGKRPHRSAPDKYPVAASSPMCRRKNISSVDINNNYVEPLVSSNSFSNDLNKELTNPQQSLSTVLDSLRSDEWENKCDGLFTIRRLAIFHSEYLNQDFHILVEAVLNEVKNLRSQVTRAALGCIADFFAHIPKLIEPEIELILNTVLLKASDTNHFIRFDVEETLKKLVENVQSQKAMAAIIATGISHRSALVRKVFAKYLADLSEKIGSSQVKATHKDIIAVAAKLSVDPQPDARYHGRRILFLLLDEPDFDKLLTKDVPSTNLRPVQDIVENLKNKGLGDPPTESAKRSSRNGFIPYSNRGSEVIRTTRSEAIKPSSELENGSANSKRGSLDTATPEKQKRRQSNKDSHGQALDLDCLRKLDSNNWSDRYEGLDDVYDVICMKPNEASANVMKIFDKFCPRLADPNSKVNLYALQTLNRCIPILRNSMSSATTLVIDNLKASLASKNEAIYLAAKEALNSLVKYVDNVYLLQPLCTTVQYSNVRNKPEFAECLADIISPVYARKPNLVNRLVLPLLWNFLSTANSGVSQSGRANLQQAMGRICKTLYQCLGKELLVEAESKGQRAAQKLEILLQ